MEIDGVASHQLEAAAGSATADSASDAATIIKCFVEDLRLAVACFAGNWVSCEFIIRG
jgi:hypothetical protein